MVVRILCCASGQHSSLTRLWLGSDIHEVHACLAWTVPVSIATRPGVLKTVVTEHDFVYSMQLGMVHQSRL